ncbi:MAG TPA: helix-turn-helix transcriptional regulator [Thermoanaerobaculia bacterium]|nr:helix-turn-helix transcriptional regulator [Thermoanaerobaculia bacterium]
MSNPPPLKPEVFEILAAMAAGELHGYAILKEIEERGTPMAASLLYRKLRRLLEDGWVEEADSPFEDESDARRRYYRLTDRGRRVLEAEARRIVELADSERVREIATAGTGSGTSGEAASRA